MRKYILTENERRQLENWLNKDEETRTTRDLFSMIRLNLPQIREDMILILKVAKKLRRLERWRRREGDKTPFGSAYRRARSALSRTRRGTNT
jgi:hypothetical protein